MTTGSFRVCPHVRIYIDDAVSRLSSLSNASGTLESYAYLGLDTVVRRSHPLPGVDLTFVKQGAEANGSAGDQYSGLDRFGRVVDQRWVKTSTGTATDRFRYGYDRDGNRLFKDSLVNAAFGEVYAYDGLNQAASFSRGTLNAGKTAVAGTASRTQPWSPDAVGNFDTVTTNGVAQARTANRQNEVLTVAGATSPVYDANGNLTKDETGKRYEYDGWYRPVRVKDAAGTTTLASYLGGPLCGRAARAKATCRSSPRTAVATTVAVPSARRGSGCRSRSRNSTARSGPPVNTSAAAWTPRRTSVLNRKSGE